MKVNTKFIEENYLMALNEIACDLDDHQRCCRVCETPDQHSNLFYNINRELLKNLISLVRTDISESDGLSKWLCRECSERVEDFTKFKDKYLATSSRLTSLLPQANTSDRIVKDEPEHEEQFVIEVLDQETYEDLSPSAETETILEDVNEASDDDSKDSIQEKNINFADPIKTGQSFQCDICFRTYVYQNSLNRHVKTAHELLRLSCPICSAKFTQRTSLVEHMKNLHKDDGANPEVFACEMSDSCSRSFNTIKMLQQHMRQHITDRVKKKEINLDTPKKKYRKQCSICGLFFKHVDEHKLTHQTENNFACQHPQCGKTFKFKTSLKVHLRIHTNERNFKCSICQKTFRVSHHLKEHLTVHSKDKSFTCESCPKRFSSKLNLYKHSKLHLNKSNK